MNLMTVPYVLAPVVCLEHRHNVDLSVPFMRIAHRIERAKIKNVLILASALVAGLQDVRSKIISRFVRASKAMKVSDVFFCTMNRFLCVNFIVSMFCMSKTSLLIE